MPTGDFVWCDLSTFHVEATKSFYAGLLGWTYEGTTQPDGSPYDIAATGRQASAGIFAMPRKFRDMGLPSFWMSYNAVEDIDATVAEARRRGGKVEVGPIPFGEGASIALIRDPLGAGFTVYQGAGLHPRPAGLPAGRMVWNALYVSDASAVTPFYEALFGWRIAADPALPGVFAVHNAEGREIAAIHQLPDAVRGRFEYWAVHFAVPDLASARARIVAEGGEIVTDDADPRRPALLARDPDGAAFYLVQAAGSGRGTVQARAAPARFKWMTVTALAILWVAVVFEVNWVWGVLFIMWTVPALSSGETYLVEPITRRDRPVLFWLLVGTWIVLSVLLIVWDVARFTGWTS